MDYSSLDKQFIADFNIDTIVAIKQNRFMDVHMIHRQNIPRKIHALLLVTDYAIHYELPDGTVKKFEVGDVVLLPKGACYTTRFIVPKGKETHPRMIGFRMTDRDGNEILLGNTVLKISHSDGALFPLFDDACTFYKESSHLQLKATVYEILGKLFPIQQEDTCCIAYINNHYTDQFQITELAKKCMLSETAYRKKFKELTGTSPLCYINNLKIEKACQMLKSSEMKPGEISEFLHFYSPQYFYRVFKQHTGMTPNQYRYKQS